MTVRHQSYLELKNRERFFPRRIPKDIKSRSSMEGSGNSSPGKFNVFSHFSPHLNPLPFCIYCSLTC